MHDSLANYGVTIGHYSDITVNSLEPQYLGSIVEIHLMTDRVSDCECDSGICCNYYALGTLYDDT